MSTGGCYINNVYVTWKEAHLFDLYKLYLDKKVDRQSFIDVYHYDNFDRAEALYKKIME